MCVLLHWLMLHSIMMQHSVPRPPVFRAKDGWDRHILHITWHVPPAMVVYLGEGSPAAAMSLRVAALSRALSQAEGGLPAADDMTTVTHGLQPTPPSPT